MRLSPYCSAWVRMWRGLSDVSAQSYRNHDLPNQPADLADLAARALVATHAAHSPRTLPRTHTSLANPSTSLSTEQCLTDIATAQVPREPAGPNRRLRRRPGLPLVWPAGFRRGADDSRAAVVQLHSTPGRDADEAARDGDGRPQAAIAH